MKYRRRYWNDLSVTLIDIRFSFLSTGSESIDHTVNGKIDLVIFILALLHRKQTLHFFEDMDYLAIESADLNK